MTIKFFIIPGMLMAQLCLCGGDSDAQVPEKKSVQRYKWVAKSESKKLHESKRKPKDSINNLGSDGKTPLIRAVQLGQHGLVQYLLEKKEVRISVLDGEYHNALWHACKAPVVQPLIFDLLAHPLAKYIVRADNSYFKIICARSARGAPDREKIKRWLSALKYDRPNASFIPLYRCPRNLPSSSHWSEVQEDKQSSATTTVSVTFKNMQLSPDGGHSVLQTCITSTTAGNNTSRVRQYNSCNY